MADSTALAVLFVWAVHAAKIHAGSIPAPLLPAPGEFALLFMLGTAWHVTARATGLYDPARHVSLTAELLTLGKNVSCQFVALAVTLFFLKSLELNRFFTLLYSAGLLGATVMVRLAARAGRQARRIPLNNRLWATGGLILLAAALFTLLLQRRAPGPDIILISIDTLRADRLGCYGYPVGTSPLIDAFSRESVQFLQAICQAPSTAGSHMSLFTGLLPTIHRVNNRMVDPETCRRMELGLALSIPTLAQYLKENGYRTGGFHGGGNVSAILGFDRGFDAYQKTPWEKLYQSPASLHKVNRWLGRDHRLPGPFFLFIHHYICHDPYLQAPPEFRRRFLKAPVPGLQEKLEAIAPEGMKTTRRFNSIRRGWWSMIDAGDPAHRRHVRDLYDAGVSYADFVFGKILDSLKKSGLYDRSVIVLLSDHGEQFWEHGGTGHEGWLFAETLHVPLLVRFPGGEYGGRKIETPVGLFDLMPTLLDYLGIKPRMKMQAHSLLPLIRGQSFIASPLVSIHEGLSTLRVGWNNFAYSNQPGDGQQEWLFDRLRDPGEQHNLAATRTRTVRQMRALAATIMNNQQILRARFQHGAATAPALSEDLRKQLKALGYL